MVVPKKLTSGLKNSKNGDKEHVSDSPEPFKEPDGMTSIDLNKSDDDNSENEVEKAKLKQKQQIRYTSRLMLVLCSGMFIITTFMTLTVVNKGFQLVPTHPNKIDRSRKLDSLERFIEDTRFLNQALFRQKLKTSHYLEKSYDDMSSCKTEQTIESCCDIFKTKKEFYVWAEYCSVKDMLDLLSDFELKNRKKRQAGGIQPALGLAPVFSDPIIPLEPISPEGDNRHQHPVENWPEFQETQPREGDLYLESAREAVEQTNPRIQNVQVDNTGNFRFDIDGHQIFIQKNLLKNAENDQEVLGALVPENVGSDFINGEIDANKPHQFVEQAIPDDPLKVLGNVAIDTAFNTIPQRIFNEPPIFAPDSQAFQQENPEHLLRGEVEMPPKNVEGLNNQKNDFFVHIPYQEAPLAGITGGVDQDIPGSTQNRDLTGEIINHEPFPTKTSDKVDTDIFRSAVETQTEELKLNDSKHVEASKILSSDNEDFPQKTLDDGLKLFTENLGPSTLRVEPSSILSNTEQNKQLEPNYPSPVDAGFKEEHSDTSFTVVETNSNMNLELQSEPTNITPDINHLDINPTDQTLIPNDDHQITPETMTPKSSDTLMESRANADQEEFRVKPKQLDAFTATEDMQSHQQRFVNPCFFPYANPYMPLQQSPKVGNPQESGYLKIVSVSQPKVQSQPTYMLNPAMYYGLPPSSAFMNPYMFSNVYTPPLAQPSPPAVTVNQGQVQVTGPGGQYYMCNHIPTPSNNIAGIPGVEVRRYAGNLQSMVEEAQEYQLNNNKSRAASQLVCPLGEQACLDNTICIKNHQICDSEVHCDDSSDEIGCDCKERVGKLRLCDGYCDCPSCEDEAACFGCEESEFSCDDWSRLRRSTCVPISQRCDGIKQCEITGKDELDCSILADHLSNFPLNKISNSVGFLHRNFKGKWYPTCFGTELWAAEVCQVEAGPSAIIPKTHMTLSNTPYDGLFINILPDNEISLVNTCVQDRAAFVECPPIYCGLRFLINNPYRDEEIDTTVEDMLSNIERAGTNTRHVMFKRDDAAPLNNTSPDDIISNHNLSNSHIEKVRLNIERSLKRRDLSADGSILKETRVVGGKPSQPAAWPWLVSIYRNGIFHCGGVLINDLWVVTASHCVVKYWQFYYEVQAGALRRFSYSPMDQRRWVKMVIPHEAYSKKNLRNDIALIKLSAPIRYNRYVRPICLPSEATAGQNYLNGPPAGTICTTVGWGATIEHGSDPDHMREVEVPILSHCKHKEDSDVEEICAGLPDGGKDACQGDSGGPLMCRNPNNPNQWYLAGVVSHGEGCARPNEPGVYTKVSRYVGWIAENTRDDKLTFQIPLQKCPGYTCKGTKQCVPKKRRCDRIIDCLFGDDETNCENRFKELFKHSRTTVVPSSHVPPPIIDPFEFVLGASQVENGTVVEENSTSTIQSATELSEDNSTFIEERSTNNVLETTTLGMEVNSEISTDSNGVKDNSSVTEASNKRRNDRPFEDTYFKCKNMLQIIAAEKRCNKMFDCEDGSDEVACTCADYVNTVEPSAICDGVADCRDTGDERNCKVCNSTQFSCSLSQKCIDLSQRCDGNVDCPQNEDELNCATLSNGYVVTLDKDSRPSFKSRGVFTVNRQGLWKPLCLNSSYLKHEEPAISMIICNLLGFDEYSSYHVRLVEDQIVNSTFSVAKGLFSSEEKCKNCCDGLYVSCSNTSTSSSLSYKSLEQVKELYFSPWMAAIYLEGEYTCMGTLLNDLWIITSINCFKNNLRVEMNYVVAVLGKGKLHLHEKGPHEQIIRVTESVNIKDTDIVLLRLEQNVKFNRYVQAAHLNARRESIRNEKCYAAGRDNQNKTMFLHLSPNKNCPSGFRCFEKKIRDDCMNLLPWSGTIICDSRSGWYPAAVFNEDQGYCGFSIDKKFTSVKSYKNQINDILKLTPKPMPEAACYGFRCPLGNCIPEQNLCDAINHCHDGSDESNTVCYEKEKECHINDTCVCSSSQLKCPNSNKCHPKSAFCDRTNNCGDFEDEPDVCLCRNYLNLTSPRKMCDGTVNCFDRSDEDADICSCKPNSFQCGENKCISPEMVCDGFKDCSNGDDERNCLTLKAEDNRTNAGEVLTRTGGIPHSGCFKSEYSMPILENICSKIGFKEHSGHQLIPSANITLTALRPVFDPFDVVWIRRNPGNRMKLRLRTGNDPFIKFVSDDSCYRLFIACIPKEKEIN